MKMKKTWRRISLLLATCLLVQSTVFTSGIIAGAAEGLPVSLAYPSFGDADTASINLSGNPNTGSSHDAATIGNGVISLTHAGSAPVTGAAYYKKKIALGENRSFSTFFTFKITPGTMAADGFIFVLNNDVNTVPLTFNAMGFPTNIHDFGIEFDTYKNGEAADPSGNHIGVDLDGSVVHTAGTALDLNGTDVTLSDGSLKYAWVDYDGGTQTLTVCVSNTNSRSQGQKLTVDNLSLAKYLPSSDVYAGFTGSYYNSGELHDISSWYFDNSYSPIDTAVNTYVKAPTDVTVAASPAADVATTSALTVAVKNADGSAAANTVVALSTNRGSLDKTTVTTDASGNATAAFTNSGTAAGIAVIKAVADGGAFTTLNLSCQAVSSQSQKISFAFPNFTNAFANGNSMLPITYDAGGTAGAAFFSRKVPLADNKAFSTFFTFQIKHGAKPADGFVFELSNNTNTFSRGDGMGYNTTPESIAVEFDTYNSAEVNDPSDNHIGFDINGNTVSVQTKDLASTNITLSDQQLKYAWVDYDGTTLTVTVSNTGARGDGQTMTVQNAGLAQVLTSKELYVGFTGSTGSYSEENDIGSWYFDSQYNPIDVSANTYTGTMDGGSAPIYKTSNPYDLNPYFQVKSYTSTDANGITIPYRLYVPTDYDSSKSYPMLLFMHGYGERGSDNYIQLKNNTGIITNLLQQASQYPCIIIVPQCPNTTRWVATDYNVPAYSLDTTPISDAVKAVMEIVGQVNTSYNIDQTRKYITGISMGGFATWDILMRYPNMFTAAVPVCGGGDPTKASRIKAMPIWMFHGDQDSSVPYQASQNMYNALVAAGSTKAKFTLYPGAEHVNAWLNAYSDPTLLPWFFGQQKTYATTDPQVLSVIYQINELPATVAKSDADQINAANTAFHNLNTTQQSAVENSAVLQAAVTALGELNSSPDLDKVNSEINALNKTITWSDKAAVEQARSDYEALDPALRNSVINYNYLTDAESQISSMQLIINYMITKINELPNPATWDAKGDIENLDESYQSLPDDMKNAVTNAGALDAAKQQIVELQAQADAVTDKITALPTAITAENFDAASQAISEARSAYDALPDSLRPAVSNSETLTKAEQALAQFQTDTQAAEQVITKITNLPAAITLESKGAVEDARAAYNALTDAQKKLVTNYEDLKKAEDTLAPLVKAKNDQDAAANVIAKITSLPATITLDSKATVDGARAAYNALTDDQKKLVTNYDGLKKAEEILAPLVKAKNDQDAAAAVVSKITSLPSDITLQNKAAVEAARTAYNALTDDQKNLVSNYNTLTAAEAVIAKLSAGSASTPATNPNTGSSALPVQALAALLTVSALAAAGLKKHGKNSR